ncbi:ATP-binding protein [Caryophanon latum]|uniref:histidine kinase n=1 Tax=Caryophanon latum TaxID=33977 RepID=A0A1C0YIS1_9BACL|nr:ATP-binding protein [Caryophanon latum]OCS86989.1 histidine kinase [Caryophanon latum]
MKRNVAAIITIVALFVVVLLMGNYHYLFNNHAKLVNDGTAVITKEQLEGNEILALDGNWSFYPNALLAPEEVHKEAHTFINVPSDWKNAVQPNEEGLSVGTYHIRLHVPNDEQYGLYIRTIRQANRLFINDIEVGGMGNPTHTATEFIPESDDRYTVFVQSPSGVLDIVIHVANLNYSEAGILYPIEFGTKEAIEKHYQLKVLVNIVISVCYIIFGVIYIISYSQNLQRKEELFFGLFAVLFGVYMSFINEKIFFLLFTNFSIYEQGRLQLGILPLLVFCLTHFVYCMYPQLVRKNILYFIYTLLAVLFIVYGVNEKVPTTINGVFFYQLIFVVAMFLSALYSIFILFNVLRKKLDGAFYIFIILTSLVCYMILLMINFLTGMPINLTELLVFILILYSFASLFSFRANVAYKKAQAMSEELLLYNEMKDEFLLKTSHELRTPLNGILNVSKSLMEGTYGSLKRTQQEHILLIHSVTQRLGNLVEDLLVSSNHFNGEMRITRGVVSMDVINDVIMEVRHLIPKEQHVTVVNTIEEHLPMLYSDELRLKQVLYNLLHNAIQHTTEGHITVSASVVNEKMHIHVTDTGKGIAPQHVKYIFNTFYRVSRDTNSGGLGLGLSITKNIIEQLGGNIFVTSTLGEGSTFSFTQPLATAEQQPLAEPKQYVMQRVRNAFQLTLPLVHEGNDKTIVIVDDDHLNIKVLADMLIQEGYTFIAFDNGQHVLDYLKTNKVDCMLVDLMMAQMSGYELCELVRKQYDMLELPIIALTAITKHSDLLLSLRVGANEYLQKPISMDELRLRIQSLLAMQQSSKDAIGEELNALYTQVTPHFVYNTLNTIIGLSYTDVDNTREALYCLATYFRAKLNVHYQKSIVSLEEEMELVKAYLYIEQMRFGSRLTINYDIDESIDCMLPALSLQPLVENAVFHGISKKQEGGTIDITVQQEGSFVSIRIQDDGVGIPKEKLQMLLSGENSRIGFTNPMKKLKLLKNASLHLESEEGKGTTVTILLQQP